MTVLELLTQQYKDATNKGIHIECIELTQSEINLLYNELWEGFDYQAMMHSDGNDRINSVLQRIGLPNIKLKKMEKQKVKYTIEVPEGMEVDQVTFKPIKTTYIDVCKELFRDRMNYIESIGSIAGSKSTGSEKYNPNNATTSKQLEKLLAINMIMNTAKWLKLPMQQFFCIRNLNDESKIIEVLGKDVVDIAYSDNY